jgi:hypothetical protein
MMETEARDALKLWKTVMTGGVYSLHVRKLSLGLPMFISIHSGVRLFG